MQETPHKILDELSGFVFNSADSECNEDVVRFDYVIEAVAEFESHYGKWKPISEEGIPDRRGDFYFTYIDKTKIPMVIPVRYFNKKTIEYIRENYGEPVAWLAIFKPEAYLGSGFTTKAFENW